MTKSTPPMVSGALPIVGHAAEFQRNRPELVRRGFVEHGSVFALKLANQNVAVVIGPENQKKFFMETDGRLSIQEPYQFLKAMFGEALFLAPHDKYLQQRPLVQELFKREKMLHYVDVMQEVVQAWLDGLGDSGEIELAGEIGTLVQEVAGDCFLGPEVNKAVGREFWDLYTDVGKALDPLLPPDLPLPKFRKRDKAKARMTEILGPIIAERRANPEKYSDFLQDIINRAEDDQSIDDEMVRNLLMALMFAGHETTAGQAAWTLILLLKHPDYLQRVLAEIEEVAPAGVHIDPKRMVQLDHIAWAVREVERLRPSADMLMRVVKEDIEFGDYIIPAGWLVQVAQEIGHKLPDQFAEPERFDPLRFSPDRAEDKQHRFNLFGFGGGTHKCTGMNFANNEMIVITALMLRQFELELVTQDTKILRGLGANKPTKTIVRYQRRELAPVEAELATVAGD
ncbi:MAG: cytochrome P450 [Ardenticatenaceae bacterium]|nr:cytochrome P450 [Ardenticatenaceae bacterium]